MTYENFLTAITESVQKEMGCEYRVLLHHAIKNNATPMDGLTILKEGEKASPTIFLNDFYQELSNVNGVEKIAVKIKQIYEKRCRKIPFNMKEFKEYEKIKTKLAIKLVNYEENQLLLKELPHKKFLDLAIICYVLVEKTGIDTASILVRQEYRKLWKVSEDELFSQAMENTPKLLPPEIKNMNDLIWETLSKQEETFKQEEAFKEEVPMYVLTNLSCFNGAAAMLYPHVVLDFANQIKADLYILPSSIHEVILIPQNSGIQKETLEQMVREVNEEEVERIEQLSNHVYCYYRKNQSFVL